MLPSVNFSVSLTVSPYRAASGTYGGVYTWQDRAAMDSANVFAIVQGHPNFTDATNRDFGVLEGPTRVTRGLVAATV